MSEGEHRPIESKVSPGAWEHPGEQIARLASEVERLQGEVVDLRRERDDEKALAEGLSKRVGELQAEKQEPEYAPGAAGIFPRRKREVK